MTEAETLATQIDQGDFSMSDLQQAAALLRQQAAEIERYKKHGVTCQTYGHVIGACAECNTHAEPETAMVDAAMVEMKNIVPPLRRSECLRLIRAALSAHNSPKQEQAKSDDEMAPHDQNWKHGEEL